MDQFRGFVRIHVLLPRPSTLEAYYPPDLIKSRMEETRDHFTGSFFKGVRNAYLKKKKIEPRSRHKRWASIDFLFRAEWLDLDKIW